MTANSEKSGCSTALLKLFGGTSRTEPDIEVDSFPQHLEQVFPFRLRDDFLSPAEISLYHVLKSAINAQAVICPKVRLSDVLFVSRPHENAAHRNRIQSKHLDFVLCNPLTMKPILGIELDDASHAREDRVIRDEFVDKVCQAANLPLLRVPAQRGYDVQKIKDQLQAYLNLDGNPASMPPSVSNLSPSAATKSVQGAPLCPKCEVPMVLRTGSKGQYQGRRFYGCVNYPNCREIIPLANNG